MFELLGSVPRLLLKQELRPIQGDRFQPTGFADLGPAVYQTADDRRMLLVESAQSVANRLEAVCLSGTGPDIDPELEGLPYVKVKLKGAVEATTSSLTEAHRINSPFIITDSGFQAEFLKRSEYAKGKPIAWDKVASAVFYFDPNSILHGVFMANLLDGRVRLPRAVTGFIEASGIREAASGGVKNNALDPTGKIRAKEYDKDVYSNVPYPRMEFTAGDIAAYFNVDVALLRGYGLPDSATSLLVALALFKVRRFLRTGLRLRTACDFQAIGDLAVQGPPGFAVPGEAELLQRVQAGIADCGKNGTFAVPAVTELTRECVEKADKIAKQGS
jgi:CRISPR-associated protein Csb1